RDIISKLQRIFQTENDIFLITSSGAGGVEASITNTLSPGDKVLAIADGFFGDRFAACVEAFGAEVIKLDFPWGKAADPDVIREELRANPDTKAVLVVFNETSTGIANDMEAIAKAIHETSDAFILVDAISGLGAMNLPTDELGCDVVVTGSQKAWMCPPGLAMLSVSQKAWRAHAEAKMPRYYFDFTAMKDFAERGQTPFTPALTTIFALNRALDMILDEGMENVFARHKRVGEYTRAGIKGLGLELFADEACASDTVTAVKVPSDIEADDLVQTMQEDYNVVIGGGKGRLEGQIVRIGHLGYVVEEDITEVLEAMEASLSKLRR
ncbi:MAG: alanine--glyoxylate aminotransferase family protein, partial [Chloroflexota bacterium]|nr:alanine--glyoxylate aminotransferase family protein [Chloroflexota bacterium]